MRWKKENVFFWKWCDNVLSYCFSIHILICGSCIVFSFLKECEWACFSWLYLYPDLKVGAKDRVPFKFLFPFFGRLLKSAPAFRLVTSCKISTSLQAGDQTRQKCLALAINSLLSSFHFAAHAMFVLFWTVVDEPFFTLFHLNPSLKAGAGFQNQHQPSGWW